MEGPSQPGSGRGAQTHHEDPELLPYPPPTPTPAPPRAHCSEHRLPPSPKQPASLNM